MIRKKQNPDYVNYLFYFVVKDLRHSRLTFRKKNQPVNNVKTYSSYLTIFTTIVHKPKLVKISTNLIKV